MTDLRPLFEGPAAAASADALAAAGPAPHVNLDTLARMLCPPAVDGEFLPDAPWVGVRRLRPVPPTPGRGPHPGPRWRTMLRGRFAAAVAATIADHQRVAVSLSGGLDSLAVLLAARAHQARRAGHARRSGRGGLVALSVDLVDDQGVSAADVAAAQLAALAPEVPHVVVRPDQLSGHRPPWDATGPRLDALPTLNAEVNAAAAGHGTTLLLSGDGADEHLAVPRYATALVAAEHGPSGAARYLADFRGVDSGIAGEAVAGAARFLLPRRARTGLYWAATWPQWCRPCAPDVLAEPYRTRAQAWARDTVAAARHAHVTAGRSWAEADAFDAIHPHDPIPAAGPVAEASPFLATTMLSAAHALPLALRYDPHGATAYQRAKAAVVALLTDPELGAGASPGAVVDPAVLPRAKQHYAGAITGGDHVDVAAPELHRAGVLRTPRLAGTDSDPATRRAVRDVEAWLSEARRRGFHIPDRGVSGPDQRSRQEPR